MCCEIIVCARLCPGRAHDGRGPCIGVIDGKPLPTSIAAFDERGGVRKTFTFDRVFGSQATTAEVAEAVSSVSDAALAGGTACLILEGARGTGKSFTLLNPCTASGGIWEGVLFSAASRILSQLQREAIIAELDDLEVPATSVALSVVGLYSGKAFDRGSKDAPNAEIKAANVWDTVSWAPIRNAADISRVFYDAYNRCVISPTRFGIEILREHIIVSLRVTKGGRTGMACFVMLLGLQKMQWIQIVAEHDKQARVLAEAKRSNLDLLTFSTALQELSEGRQEAQKLVTWTRSALTRVLTPFFGNGARVVILLTMIADEDQRSQTTCTLGFGEVCMAAKRSQQIPETRQLLSAMVHPEVLPRGAPIDVVGDFLGRFGPSWVDIELRQCRQLLRVDH